MYYYNFNTQTPIGIVKLIANDESLLKILWHTQASKYFADDNLKEMPQHTILKEAVTQLNAYFNNQLQKFNLPIAPKGTDFQQKVWKNLLKIPYGKTVSYLDIAKTVGNPKAVRAVGSAIGNNPLSIIIPCHRVIGSNGKLTGFAGGLDKKAYLLQLEQ